MPLWSFVMLTADPTAFLEQVRQSERPYTVVMVTLAMMRYVEPETGKITATQRQIAKAAGIDVAHVNRAMDRLVEMGALIREGRGQYRFYPDFVWRGTLAGRAQTLQVIEGGRAARKRA
jgi:DNA-binding MarR family transcriptional regulator